jgi:hypothetical protein
MPSLQTLIRSPAVKRVIVGFVVPVLDVLLAPTTLLAALLLKAIRRVGVYRLRVSRAIFNLVGVFPIWDHYYEPMFNPRHLRRPLEEDRSLPGIDLRAAAQLEFLARFRWQEELTNIPVNPVGATAYGYDNPNFRAGDAEYFYSLIRLVKPRRIYEVGSGMSTLMARLAVAANRREDPAYACDHLCIEPYEMPWLEQVEGVKVLRQRIEDVDAAQFAALDANDILFIDSSHVIRPQGDVLRVFLEILPTLRTGVYVHVHDIFTPRDYLREWVVDQVKLWNEQYLVEAFLTLNQGFAVVGALNYLSRHHRQALAAACPMYARTADTAEPGSLWLLRR